MIQGALDFSAKPKPHRIPGGRQGRAYRRLMQAKPSEPVSLMDFDRREYGTSVGRLIRFFRQDAWKWGLVLKSEWRRSPDCPRYTVWWVERKAQ